ncbi:MAG: LamB/YcsF family protein [Kurthia sp.]|nr:LamB/YcsF family protein [Candidatus Kurthia equi]
MLKIDLNCDLGESFGTYKLGNDELILDYVTSANIACGFHAGDPSTMRKTVELALSKNVKIGAHPGLQDLIGFGRRNMAITPKEAFDLIVYQIGALQGFTTALGGKLEHVKPHGALYNMAAKDEKLSFAIAEAVYKVNPELVLYGLSGSELIRAGEKVGLKTASEVFSDRTYQEDGSLTSRLMPNALIVDDTKAVNQVMQMIKNGTVKTEQKTDLKILANTVCIHGDGEHALPFAKFIHQKLKENQIEITAFR